LCPTEDLVWVELELVDVFEQRLEILVAMGLPAATLQEDMRDILGGPCPAARAAVVPLRR
jgi:hypothetical protein